MRRKFYTVLEAGEKSLIIVPENTRVVALQADGTRSPFYMIDSFPYFIDVVSLLGPDQPVLSIIGHEDMMADSYSIADEAAQHVQTILEHQPAGPYMLGGCSASGIVAYETAQQLHALGRKVSKLVLFDTPNPYYMREYSALWMSLNSYREDLHRMRISEIPAWVIMKFKKLISKQIAGLEYGSLPLNGGRDQMGPSEIRIRAARKYRPASYEGSVILFRRYRELVGRYLDPQFGWGTAVRGDVEICQSDALDHLEIFKSELDRLTIARVLRKHFDQVFASSPNSGETARNHLTLN
jgi:thioesterase domain-containing protein